MSGKLGFAIYPNTAPKLSSEVIQRFAALPTGNIADAMGRFRAMDAEIKPIWSGMRMAGQAVTVMTRPGDNLMVHKALEVAAPGEIVVVDTTGGYRSAVFGELMASVAKGAGLGGIVVDGCVRDAAELEEIGFPTFAKTVAATACDKDGPGEINTAISCGGVAVLPGDVIVGDDDGIVVIPIDLAMEVLEASEAKAKQEEQRLADIAAGKLFTPDINKTLKDKGVI